MLEFVRVRSSEEIKSIIKGFEPTRQTWIVSDLKSKQEIQRKSIEEYGYYTDEAIMRISDFWQLWLRRLEPTLKVVSSDFIKTMVQDYVDSSSHLSLNASEVSTLNRAVQEFAPIIIHPASEDILLEWLAENRTEKRWKRWYLLASQCLKTIVQKNKIIDSKWCAAYLQTIDLNKLSWHKKIYVDLGSEMSSIEMGILSHLSKTQDVVIISPEPSWKNKFPYLLNTYKENYGYDDKLIFSEGSEKTNHKNLKPEQFIRLSTQLSEVKFAVAVIRKWLDTGVDINKIAVVGADIEHYWPTLQYFLDVEGIAYQKEVVARLNSLGDIQSLLAILKNYSQDVTWESLEKSFFNKNQNELIKYEKFKSLFFQLYDDDDLSREQQVKDLFYKKQDFNKPINREDFLSFLLRIWIELPESESKAELFEPVFKDLLSQSINVSFKLAHWVQFFKSRLSHKEFNVKKQNSTGLFILPLMSAHMIDANYRIYLGLSDEFYHRKQNTLITLEDSIDLKHKFDLAIDSSEESFLDFNLRWQAESNSENYIFLSAATAFNSDPLNASLFFIENQASSEVQLPSMTRADELQKKFSSRESFSDLSGLNNQARLVADIQGEEITVRSDIFKKLSVSDIEKFSQCPFKLLAQKGFALKDVPQVSIDLDNRDKGNLAHSLFEFLIKQITKNSFDENSVIKFLDEERVKKKLYLLQDNIWKVQRNKWLEIAQRFYRFEKDRVKHVAVETESQFKIYFDLSKKIFTKKSPKEGFEFNIRIDRIDKDKSKKYSVIYDYKYSPSAAKNYNKWLSENSFQMLLYLIALELQEDLIEKPKGALFYVYKSFNIKNGLIDKDIAEADFSFGRAGSKIDDEGKKNLVEEFQQVISQKLENLKKSDFSAQPFNKEICIDCDWNKICRAPHLM